MERNKHLHLYDITKCTYHHHHQKLHESYCEGDPTTFVAGGVNLAVMTTPAREHTRLAWSRSCAGLRLPPL